MRVVSRGLAALVLFAAALVGGASPARADAVAVRVPLPIVGTTTTHPVFKAKSGKFEARVLLAPGDLGGDAPSASVVILSLDGRTELPLHRQTSAKIIVVVEGEGRVRSAKDKRGGVMQTGDAVYVPAGAPFGFLATCCKHGPTRLAIVYLPAGPEQAYLDPAAPRAGTTPVKAGEDGPALEVVARRQLKPVKLDIPGVTIGSAHQIVTASQAGVDARLGAASGGKGWLGPIAQPQLWLVFGGGGEIINHGALSGGGNARAALAPGTAVYLPVRTHLEARLDAGTQLLIVTFLEPNAPSVQEEKKSP